jgi:predicted secreted Zn-dependent protease
MSVFRIGATGFLVVALLALAGVVAPHGVGTPQALLAELASIPGVTIDQYSVVGRTAEEVRAELDRLGPKDAEGNPRDAYTEWKVSWRWPATDKGTDFSNTIIDRRVHITLPRWENRVLAAPEVRSRWNSYLAALVRHEREHVSIVDERAPLIAQEIRSAYESNPQLTVREAHLIAGRVLARIRAADREYDERTRHGHEEGVRFP